MAAAGAAVLPGVDSDEPRRVPDVVADTVREAQTELRDAGVRFRNRYGTKTMEGPFEEVEAEPDAGAFEVAGQQPERGRWRRRAASSSTRPRARPRRPAGEG